MKHDNKLFALSISIALFIGALGGYTYAAVSTPNMDHSTMMDMSDPMMMSMQDMGKMLEGKTGDELDKAFLEGMIPHHRGAINMARYLIYAKHPELKELGQEIIIAQQAEIDQMRVWLEQWGYAQ